MFANILDVFIKKGLLILQIGSKKPYALIIIVGN